jgi:hypothetical protein
VQDGEGQEVAIPTLEGWSHEFRPETDPVFGVPHERFVSKGSIALGSNVAEGSYFQNGEVTLTFQGLSQVDGRPSSVRSR